MKRITTLIAAALFASTTLTANDQLKLIHLPSKEKPFRLWDDENTDGMKGKFVVTAGAGLNFLGTTMELRYLTNSYYEFDGHISRHSTTPLFYLGVDYGFHRRFSAGVSLGMQKAYIYLKDVVTVGDSQRDTWTRINFAARADYYIVAKERANLYTGIKVGYNVYTVSSTVPKEVYPEYTGFLERPSATGVQGHLGFSYFFGGMVGFNTEIGLGYGVPYVFAVGLTAKM